MHNTLYPLVIKAKRLVLVTTFCILDTYSPQVLSFNQYLIELSMKYTQLNIEVKL